MTSMHPWIVVTADDETHFIDRAHVVEVVFRATPALGGDGALVDRAHAAFWMIQGSQGTSAETGRLVARIVTSVSVGGHAYTVEVYDDEARRLYQELHQQAGRAGNGEQYTGEANVP